MALNKFYDAINGTLTLPKNEAFELAARRKGQTFQTRLDAESNQAMFEIAETFMDSEDYDNAIKFFDRLWRLDQLSPEDLWCSSIQARSFYIIEGQEKVFVKKRELIDCHRKRECWRKQVTKKHPVPTLLKSKKCLEAIKSYIHIALMYLSHIIFWH